MATRLVDSAAGFQPVFSIYKHEALGCLISPHVVQELPNGRLSLQHQGLFPGNMDQFAHKLDPTEKKLVSLFHEISPKEIVKKYGSRVKNELEFFLKYYRDSVQQMVEGFINRKMAEALNLLVGKKLFLMGNDGYPAWKEVSVLEQKATVRFLLTKLEEETRYSPSIRLGGKEIHFQFKEADILCNSPAWIFVGNEVFSFEQEMEGSKLRPFLNKAFISIPQKTEDQYFQKFLTPLMERYEVLAKGLDVREVRERPKFRMTVDHRDSRSIAFKLESHYGDFAFPLSKIKPLSVELQKQAEGYVFFKVHRDSFREQRVKNLVDELGRNEGMFNLDFMDRQRGLAWIAEHAHRLRELEIAIVQETKAGEINLQQPQIEIFTQESGDWFDIQAMVSIGEFRIPFIRFRNHILRGRREYVLPDGSVAVLPESWFSDYRHLVEVAVEREGEVLSIKNYQVGVLGLGANGLGEHRSFLSRLQSIEEIAEFPLPEGIRADLRPYQRRGYDWLCFLRENKIGGILADDMGLGKTLQVLTLLTREKENGADSASLIVMPTSLLYNWQQEARKFSPGLRVLVHAGLYRPKAALAFKGYDLVLTTYGTARQDLELLQSFPFHYLILDESQMIKNPASKTAKAINQLRAHHRVSVTGTPIENTLLDLWSQMNFLNPGLLGSESFFRDFYVSAIEKEEEVFAKDRLRRLIHPFLLRRTKTQVASELPPKVEQIHYCEMEEEQAALYQETKNAYRNYLLQLSQGEEFAKNKLNILAGLQKLRQIAIHPGLVDEGAHLELPSGKYGEFRRMLDEVLSKGAKVLVFSQFVKLLTLIRKDLDRDGVAYAYLDGGTRDRMEQVQQFQTRENLQVFLISLKAGGTGLNLTAAEYVFILDPWWNPAVENQAVDRSHRIGQQKTVFSYKFITRDSIEEKIVKLQERKKNLSGEIVTVEEDIFKKLELADLTELLS